VNPIESGKSERQPLIDTTSVEIGGIELIHKNPLVPRMRGFLLKKTEDANKIKKQ
jgi:hypothetical protein|tara:strand:+ start:482 stop:646 length:165 start_codon:yes stop_codon:yes gene_type:complete